MVCTCKEGFTGDLCDININDCLSNPCIHGKCVDGIASYRCDCNKGYFGKQCEHEQKENDKGAESKVFHFNNSPELVINHGQFTCTRQIFTKQILAVTIIIFL